MLNLRLYLHPSRKFGMPDRELWVISAMMTLVDGKVFRVQQVRASVTLPVN